MKQTYNILLLQCKEVDHNSILLTKKSELRIPVTGAEARRLVLSNFAKPNHIYIVSGEEIKVGDWYFNPANKNYLITHENTLAPIERCEYDYEAKACLDQPVCLKIVASTDPILHEDGVSKLEKELLENFIKVYNQNGEFIKNNVVDLFGLKFGSDSYIFQS